MDSAIGNCIPRHSGSAAPRHNYGNPFFLCPVCSSVEIRSEYERLNAASHVPLISGLWSRLKLKRFLSVNPWHLFVPNPHCSTPP